MSEKIFREIIIWKEIDDNKIARYRCFHVLPINKYFVKCQEYFYYPLEKDQLELREFEFIDSLFQGGLNMEDEFYDSLETAIERFDKEFDTSF
jgi:hypothetical protein